MKNLKKLLPFITYFLVVLPGVMFGYGEFLIDTTYLPVCDGSGYMPTVAFDGTNFTAVWSNSGIFATRINQSGAVIDTGGILITETGGQPDICFDGTNYLVVWTADSDIYGARMSPQGVVLDSGGFVICNAQGEQIKPSLAFNGTNYLVVWDDSRWQGSIYGARVTPSGIVLDTIGIPISLLGSHSNAVASNGIDYLAVCYCEGFGLYSYKVSANGTVGQGNYISSYYTESVPQVDISFDGTNYLCVWRQQTDARGARISPSGVCIDPDGFMIASSGGGYGMRTTFDGTKHLVVWSNWNIDGNLFGAFVYPDNTVTLMGTLFSVGDNHYPTLAFGANEYLIIWEQYMVPLREAIVGKRIDSTGTILDSCFSVSLLSHIQSRPAISFNGTDFLMACQDDRGRNTDIYGLRVSQLGQILDPAPLPFACSEKADINPALGTDGLDYLLSWTRHTFSPTPQDTLMALRVDQNGVIIDTPAIRVVSGLSSYYKPTQSAISFDGANYLVVWDSTQYSSSFVGDIYGTFISPTGNIVDTVGVCNYSAEQISPAVAFNGTNYLVVWRDNRYGWENQFEVYGTRLTPAGTVLDPNGIRISPFIPANDFLDPTPAVATDGNNYFVVCGYREYAGGQDNYNIYGTRVDSAGNVLDPTGIPICVAEGTQGNPAVAFDGADYLVVWQDDRYGQYDIYGAKVSTEGIVIDTFIVVNQPGDQVEPEIVKANGDTLLIVYSGFTPEINDRPANTMRIWGVFYPLTGIKETVNLQSNICNPKLIIYPNPFKNALNIKFQIPNPNDQTNSKSQTLLKIYDISGRLVKSFNLSTRYSLLATSAEWDGTDDSGRRLPSGVYFVKIETGAKDVIKKVVKIE